MGISPKTVIGPCKLLLKRRSQRHCPNLYTVRLAWGTAWSWYGHGLWTSVSLKSHKAVSKQSTVSPLENREFLERNRSYVTQTDQPTEAPEQPKLCQVDAKALSSGSCSHFRIPNPRNCHVVLQH